MTIKKILNIIVIFLIIFFINLPIIVEASNLNVGQFEVGGNIPEEITNFTNSALGTAISIARIVGACIAIVILLIIACRYMIASPGDRADIKKHAIPFVIGAFVLFGASGILGVIVDVASSLK